MRRVVVTGLGIVSPLGNNLEENWKNILASKSGISTITKFDASSFPVKIAGEVKNFDASLYMDKKIIKQMDYFIQYAMAAGKMAMDDSGFVSNEENATRFGVIVGAGLGGLPEIEETHTKLIEKGPGRISPFFIPRLIANLAPGQLSMAHGAKGPNFSPVSACATGNHSIGEAFKMIQNDVMDFAIAGSTEGTISPLCVGGFAAMRALSERNDTPELASSPFDKKRDGFVVGEGSGILILEELEAAKKRGARILAELCGYGASSDAYHLTSPAPEGEGAQRAMKLALKDAKLNADQIDYINAHGTSTPQGDIAETVAVKRVFGNHAYKLKMSSTKSMTGHLLGGAGGIEAVYAVMSIVKNTVPATINLQDPDPDCDLDYVANTPRELPIRTVLSNSFGFGGTNATLIFRRYA